MKESPVQQRIRLDAAQTGVDLWRNNVGACIDDTGRAIRYGLCNESKELNHRVKSSDLIGIVPVIVTPQMVGYKLGIFAAIECKASNWVFNPGDQRAVAQKAFHDIILSHGGMAGFAASIEDYRKIVWK